MSEKLIFFNRIKKIIAGSTVPYPERENPWLEIGYITYYEDSYKVYLSFYVKKPYNNNLHLEMKIPRKEEEAFDSLEKFRTEASTKFKINIERVNNRSNGNSAFIFAIKCDKEGYPDQEKWAIDNYETFISAMKWMVEQSTKTFI